MRARLQKRLVAALMAPALIASAAAQGMLLMRCGTAAAFSCCCPGDTDATSVSVATETHPCCDRLAIPRAPAQRTPDRAVSSAPEPVLLQAVATVPIPTPPFATKARVFRTGDPPGFPVVLAHCTLLI